MTFARFQETWLQLDNKSFGSVVTLCNMGQDPTGPCSCEVLCTKSVSQQVEELISRVGTQS